MTSFKTPESSVESLQGVLLDRVAIGVCIIVGGVMALAYSNVLPVEALLVGFPALLITQLLDTFLFNVFRIDTGVLVWGMIAVFVYLESVAIGLLVRWLQSRN